MEHMFVKTSPCRGIQAIIDERSLSSAINQNIIQNYSKSERMIRGSYVTCIKKDGVTMRGDGYREGFVFQVSDVLNNFSTLIMFGGINGDGVYYQNLRLATEKEIEKYKQDVSAKKVNNYFEEDEDDFF